MQELHETVFKKWWKDFVCKIGVDSTQEVFNDPFSVFFTACRRKAARRKLAKQTAKKQAKLARFQGMKSNDVRILSRCQLA